MNEKPARYRSQAERFPEESFDPEWGELWLKASREAFTITFPNRKKLNAFRLQAQIYRNIKRLKNREGWRLLYRAKTTTNDAPGEKTSLELIFYPSGEPHREFFEQAGIVTRDSGEMEILPNETASASAPAPDPDDFINQLKREMKIKES